jgi:multiple sugar transport system permease protein
MSNLGIISKKSWRSRFVRIITLENKNSWKLLVYPGIILLFIITIVPTLYALFLSFQSYNLAKPNERHFNFFLNYVNIFLDRRFWNGFAKTATFTVISLCAELILGMLLALSLTKSVLLKSFVQICILVPMITTPVVVGLVWKMFYDVQFGMLNYLLGFFGMDSIDMAGNNKLALLSLIIIDIWEWTPYVTLILLAGLQSLPVEPYESAIVDGAGSLAIFRWITLPLLMPVLSVAVIFRFMDLFKWMDTIYVVTFGGPGFETETLSYYTYTNTFKFLEIGYGSALCIFMLMVILVICNSVGKKILMKGRG